MTVKTVKTRRKLGMHEKLLFDTIERQAGTLEKANTEGVMNSIEAGASSVYITLVVEKNSALLGIKDDGEGINTKEDLIAHFETFGTPHNENENTHWKQFRMGRGQMFAFGKNVWRTATFRMTVDIKNWGLEYDLEEHLPYYDGCDISIELYKNPIGYYPYPSMESYEEAIKTQIRFVEIPVYFNNTKINTPPSECNWDDEDSKAYFLFNVGTDLYLYNLGVFVMKIPASRAGMGGIVVSKQQLKVNFARNDVICDCPVYTHINDIIKKNRIANTRRTRRALDVWQRQACLQDLRDGNQDYNDIKNLSLIPTAQGKHISLEVVKKNRQPWCFAEHGSDIADRMMEREQALCIDEDILAQLNYNGPKKEFFNWLVKPQKPYGYSDGQWSLVGKLYKDFDILTNGVSDEYTILPDKKLTLIERRIIRILNSFYCWKGRIIGVGVSDRANAWTDGVSYITIDKSYLQRFNPSALGVNKLMLLLAHEMAHDNDTRGTHVHGPEFYENMVNVLESNDSPTICNATFYHKIQQSKITEKRMQEEEKKQKTKKKIETKLGLTIFAKS